MKKKRFVRVWAVLALLVSLGIGVGGASGAMDELGAEAAAGTVFTYQGLLQDGSGPVNATCDLQFKLWDAISSGAQVGGTVLLEDVVLVDGLFTARLDFGAEAFRGQARYLEVAASCPVGSAFVPLPRQELTGSPYALWALGAPWSGLTGVPADLADGDQDTTYTAGAGLSLVGGQFSVTFAGTGSAGTASRSDHNHDAAYVNEGQANSVSTGMVQNSTLLLEDLNQNGCSTGQIIKWSGSAWACAADATEGTSFWSLTGNAGTTPGTNYLGTSDNTALEIKVNGARALRLEPGSSPNLLGGYSGNLLTAGVTGATVSGGGSSGNANRVTDSWGTVGGGTNNRAGDNANTVDDARFATVSGGYGNTAGKDSATVGGGYYNSVIGVFSTVGGGEQNDANGERSTVAGGSNNEAIGPYATVGGGADNSASNDYATVGGGILNTASYYCTVGGGIENTASGWVATVGGGADNTANGEYSTVAGGLGNAADQYAATVSGGDSNTASVPFATVGGGSDNNASGLFATVPGGENNTAAGDYSFAAGRQAKALHEGSFVWADNTDADFSTDAANQFLVRASGGVKVVRGTNTFSPSQSALQVEQAEAFEAGWFYTANLGNPYAVLKVAKDPAAPGNFVDGVDRTAAGAETRRFHITASGTYVGGSDFAESLPVAGDPASFEPGDVLVISLDRAGAVEKCDQPYDSLVVGVYSTRPGFLGADKGGYTEVLVGEVPVAVVGIVPVKVTDENGPIQPGDLLTTSSTAGHAMRCEGWEPCFGRTLGKALEGLPAGQPSGVIRVLVSLQ